MSVTTATTTPNGTYSLTITGTSGALTHTTSVTLVVNAPAADFSLSASPASRSVPAGARTSYTINVSRTGGFAGGVTLSATGMPPHTTASFRPNPASGASSTMTVSTSGKTPLGTYTLTITGTSGALNHTTGVTLVVSSCGQNCM
jgi:serine protease AprX